MSRATIETIALLATAVLVCALVPDASFFGPDQVGILLEGRGVLHGALFPPGPGIGWTPFKLGPLFEWVTAVGLLPRNEFADVIVLVAVIHGVSVLGWRRLFAEVADSREARIAGWALALHPLAISSGCAPISTSIVMPTTLVFVWGIVRWVRARDAVGFVIACVGAALMIQAHLTTAFLLPLFLVGFRRKAPIGRVGFAGLVMASLIAAPMVIPNLRAVAPGTFRHAGTSGAPLVTALFRAATIEARVLEIAGVPATWGNPAYVAGLLWGVFILVGAVVLVRRRDDGIGRALLVFGLVVPTLCVALLPRGALFLYLDSTVPVRSWLFANGVCALAAPRAKSRLAAYTSMLARIVAVVAAVVPAGVSVSRRTVVAERGYLAVSLSRIDLREPLGRSFESVGIPTLGSVRALGRALDGIGADPQSITETLHGPWRWATADSVGVWIAESRRNRTAPAPATQQASGADGAASFIVLHEDDHSAAPASTPAVAGRFRVYRFDNRLRVTSADAGRVVGAVETGNAGKTTMQVVTEFPHHVVDARSPDGELAGMWARSTSGFVVWSSSIEASEAVTVDFDRGELYVEQVRSPADAYAFVPAVPAGP